MKKTPSFRRVHGMIIFGEGTERWAVTDPENQPELEEQRHQLTERKEWAVRGLISDYLYLIIDCPTTKLAQEKIADIRRALRMETENNTQ